MAGDDFRKNSNFFAQIGVCCGCRNLIIRGSAILLRLRGSQQGSSCAAVFGCVNAVEHNGKCKIRGRSSTFEGSKSLTAEDDISKKLQFFRAHWSLLRQPEPHNTWPAQYFGDFETGSSGRRVVFWPRFFCTAQCRQTLNPKRRCWSANPKP